MRLLIDALVIYDAGDAAIGADVTADCLDGSSRFRRLLQRMDDCFLISNVSIA